MSLIFLNDNATKNEQRCVLLVEKYCNCKGTWSTEDRVFGSYREAAAYIEASICLADDYGDEPQCGWRVVERVVTFD